MTAPDAAARAERLVVIGAVMRAHGLRGEVRLKLFNPGSPLLGAQRAVWLGREGETPRTTRISGVRLDGDGALARLEGIADRDSAEALRGTLVSLPRSAFPPLEPGEFYHVDLPGLEVVTAVGEVIGVVDGVLDYPAATVICVQSEAGTREIPLIAPWLVEVDLARGVVVVAELEGIDVEPKKKPKAGS